MITPRTTRLVRVGDLQAFREAVVSLACLGAPLDARDRLVVVPTQAAAAHLVRTIEDEIVTAAPRPVAVLLPDVVTPGELVRRLADRLPGHPRLLTTAEREILLGVAAGAAADAGHEPPFRLRPGLIAEMLRFYDALRENERDIETFERLTLGMLEPGAADDRGAARLLRQTRFLVAAFREFEQRCAAAGVDAHVLRDAVIATPSARPYRHVIVTVGDRGSDPHGLAPAHWDALTRLPGLDRLDVVVTDAALAGAVHERLHQLLPGVAEVRFAQRMPPVAPILLVPAGGSLVHAARDREEEVSGFARWIKASARAGELPALDRAALVVRQPLPYVYVAREVLRSAGVPSQSFDALPLAAEPYAAAVDLVMSCVASSFARGPSVALLRCPHIGHDADPLDVVALDRALGEAGYLGEADALECLSALWNGHRPGHDPILRAARASTRLLEMVRALLPLRSTAPASAHLEVLLEFLVSRDRVPPVDDDVRARHLRARSAILATIQSLRDAYARFDDRFVGFDDVAAVLRRWIADQTFAPRTGESGVHLVDADSARFGSFDHVQIAGMIEGEWPEGPRRNIFFSPAVLRQLGWPGDASRIDGARASFADLLRLPARRLVVSTFTLEADALVSPSPLLDELEHARLEAVERALPDARIFAHEALGLDPVDQTPLTAVAREWLARRMALPPAADLRYRGSTAAHRPAAFSLSALERYQDCPFKYFAADVLRLEEAPDDEAVLSPKARGRFVHEVFQRFFQTWDERGEGAITSDRLEVARALFADVAAPLLAQLPQADAALERTRLFGSAISLGIVDVVLGLEASRPDDVQERWLEYRLDGEFALGSADRRVPLKGVADRIDLLAGNRLRVIDYKTGSAPNPRRALQVPIYALCAQERLHARDGAAWTIDGASYVVLSGKRALVPVVRTGGDRDDALPAARERLLAAVDAIGEGEFPPRPHDPMICRYCAYASVCRKDYVLD